MFNRVRRIKSLSAIFLILLLGSLLLSGCGQEGTSPKQETGDKPATEEKQSASNFPEKDITFIIPVSPGGSFDTFSRILAPYLQKYLPNNPNVIIKNVTGGGWSIGVSEINRAKPDGYTIGIFNNGNVVQQLTGADYDLTKITWIGRLHESVYVGAVSAKSKLKSFEDIKKAGKVKAGVVSLTATDGLGSLITFDEVGVEPKFITHKGSSEAVLSGVRGDVDYVQLPLQTVNKFIETKDLIPVVVFSPERLPMYPDVPTIKELGYEGLLDIVKLSALVGGPPGMAEDATKVLREAFDKAISDPEFLQKMEKAAESTPLPGSSDVATDTAQNSFDTFSKYKELLLANQK